MSQEWSRVVPDCSAGDDREAAIVLLLPVLAGVAAPWAAWAVAGWVGAWELAFASLGLACAYLGVVWWLGEREAARRRRLGRRYIPPPPDFAFAVCMGIAASLIAPALSAAALVDRIGLPRAEGTVRDYDAHALEAMGMRIDLSRVLPGPGALDVLPGGGARVLVPRFGNPTEFVLPWRAVSDGFCIAPGRCLELDRHSGRVRIGEDAIGRVTAVGPALIPAGAAVQDPPWEIVALFR